MTPRFHQAAVGRSPLAAPLGCWRRVAGPRRSPVSVDILPPPPASPAPSWRARIAAPVARARSSWQSLLLQLAAPRRRTYLSSRQACPSTPHCLATARDSALRESAERGLARSTALARYLTWHSNAASHHASCAVTYDGAGQSPFQLTASHARPGYVSTGISCTVPLGLNAVPQELVGASCVPSSRTAGPMYKLP
jgi:hypothetical protein